MTAYLLFAAGVLINVISMFGTAVVLDDANTNRRPQAGWVVLALWLSSLLLMGAA